MRKKKMKYLAVVLILLNLVVSECRHFPKHHRKLSHRRFNKHVSPQGERNSFNYVGEAVATGNKDRVLNEFDKRASPIHKHRHPSKQGRGLNSQLNLPSNKHNNSSINHVTNYTTTSAKPHATTSTSTSHVSTKHSSVSHTTSTTGSATTGVHLTNGPLKPENITSNMTTLVTSEHQVIDQAMTNISNKLQKVKLMVAATKVKADLQSLIDEALKDNDNSMKTPGPSEHFSDAIKSTTSSHMAVGRKGNKGYISTPKFTPTSKSATLATISGNAEDSTDQTNQQHLEAAASDIESDVHTLLGIMSDGDSANKTSDATTPFTGSTTIGTQSTPKPFPGEYQGYIPVTKAERSIVPLPLSGLMTNNSEVTNHTKVPGKLTHHHKAHKKKHSKSKLELHHLPELSQSSDILEKHQTIANELSVINENILNGMKLLKHKLTHLNVKLHKALREIGDREVDNTNEERTDIKVNSDKIAQLQQGLEGKIDDLRYNITSLIKSQKELADTMTWSMQSMMGMLSHMVDKVTNTEAALSTILPKPSKYTNLIDEMVTLPSEVITSNMFVTKPVLDTINDIDKIKRSDGTSNDNITHFIAQTTTTPVVSIPTTIAVDVKLDSQLSKLDKLNIHHSIHHLDSQENIPKLSSNSTQSTHVHGESNYITQSHGHRAMSNNANQTAQKHHKMSNHTKPSTHKHYTIPNHMAQSHHSKHHQLKKMKHMKSRYIKDDSESVPSNVNHHNMSNIHENQLMQHDHSQSDHPHVNHGTSLPHKRKSHLSQRMKDYLSHYKKRRPGKERHRLSRRKEND